MADWMISKKRYWGLALPIWECASCQEFDVISSRDELKQRAVEGWDLFEGHTPHRPYVDAVKVACSSCGGEMTRIADVGNPWLDAGIVPFSTMHYRTEPDYWRQWFPADFVTESFPGQFRNWFYSMLAMSTVLRREPPFKALMGYATLYGDDGRPMHKSWGNAVEFNEGAERIGVDVMRWMFAGQRLDDNILFGYRTADEARRELLVLWNVYVFFVTYARLAGWKPERGIHSEIEMADDWPLLDRWILSRVAGLATSVRTRLEEFDAAGAVRLVGTFIDELSTWYLRRSRGRMRLTAPQSDRNAAFSTLHATLIALSRVLAPILPFLSESMYQNLVAGTMPQLPDSVHLTSWPDDIMAQHRDQKLEAAMDYIVRAVDLGRTLRSQAGLNLRQPIRHVWVALPAGAAVDEELLASLGEDDLLNAKSIERIAGDSDLIERRVKPLLPKIGKRLGPQTQAVLAAARNNEVEYLSSGAVRLAGVELAADEVELIATPRAGTAIAHDQGLVVAIDTELDDELRAEGDARELTRAVQDLRKQAGLELDDTIELWLSAPSDVLAPLHPYMARVAADTLADNLAHDEAPSDALHATQSIGGGDVVISLRRIETAP
jgi:isoleucyl-tRNA synthetase